jgi:hypothetical protein
MVDDRFRYVTYRGRDHLWRSSVLLTRTSPMAAIPTLPRGVSDYVAAFDLTSIAVILVTAQQIGLLRLSR